MPETLIPADEIVAAVGRATTYEGLKGELAKLIAGEKITQRNEWSVQLDSFARLQPGWDGYSASPPSADVIANTRRLMEDLNAAGLLPARVAPSVVGGIGLTFKKSGRKAYFELTNGGATSLLLSDGVTEPHSEPIAIGDPALAVKIREYLGE